MGRWGFGTAICRGLMRLTLHVADVRPAIIGLRRTRRLSLPSRDLRASTQREDEQHSREPHMPVHCATTGSIRLGSLFLTLAASGLTGPQVIRCPEGVADHSITSSARSSMVGGTVRPSALAVLRLMISAYFVGC